MPGNAANLSLRGAKLRAAPELSESNTTQRCEDWNTLR
jgi:hypothetical protein